MNNTNNINNLDYLEKAILTKQINQIKEIWEIVKNKSRKYLMDKDSRCVYLKILIDNGNMDYNWVFESCYDSPYDNHNIYIDIFNDYTEYRFSTLPKPSEFTELIQQDDKVYLIMRKRQSAAKIRKFPIITLCGSTKFKDEYIEAQKNLTLQGYIVISVGLFGHSGDEEALDDINKQMLVDIHMEKIRMADKIYVINKNNYIGQSTKKEIEFAKSLGKEVLYMF